MTNPRIAIIGGGPAGMIAAIQLKRYGLEAALFEQKRLGGLLWNANLVENYPGFPGGIPGSALAARIAQQFESQDLTPVYEKVDHLDHDGTDFLLTTDLAQHTARIVVLATGTRPNTLPANLIPAKARELVSYEVADLPGLTGAKVAVVGAGDAAFDYALNLAARGNQVMIFNRGRAIQALSLLVDRVAASPQISYHANAELKNVQRQGEHLHIEVVDGNRKTAYKVDRLLAAIGRSPAQPAYTERLTVTLPAVSESGQFIQIGDVCNGRYRQTAIAAGDGLRAAMKIYQFLKEA